MEHQLFMVIKKELTMKTRKILFVFAIFLFAVIMLCCDRAGDLSEHETEEFYEELQQDVEKGEFWNLDAVYLHRSKEISDDLSLLRLSIETIFLKDEQKSNEYGRWFSKKSFCKVYTTQCNLTLQENETGYVIEKLTIAKYYKNNSYKIWLYYRQDEAGSEAQYIEVVLQ